MNNNFQLNFKGASYKELSRDFDLESLEDVELFNIRNNLNEPTSYYKEDKNYFENYNFTDNNINNMQVVQKRTIKIEPKLAQENILFDTVRKNLNTVANSKKGNFCLRGYLTRVIDIMLTKPEIKKVNYKLN